MTEIQFDSARTIPAAADHNCRLSFFDGTTLHGDLIAIEAEHALLRSPFSQDPISCRIDALRRCEFKKPGDQPHVVPGDVLEYSGLKLHGALAVAETSLGWRLVGADAAIPLDLSEPIVIRHREAAGNTPESAAANSDIVMLRGGDLLPCRVESIDDDAVSISTDFSEPARIPSDDVQAVSLEAETRSPINGFDDPKWRFDGQQPIQLERRDDSIDFHDGAGISHPTLMAGGNLDFDIDWNRKGHSYLMLTLTSQGVARRGNPGIEIDVGMAQDHRMFTMIFNENNLMVYVREGQGMRVVHQGQVSNSTTPVHVSLRRIEEGVTLSVDGQELGDVRVPPEQLASMGVAFKTQAQQNNRRQRGGDLGMTISNLRAGSGNGLFSHLPITKSAHAAIVTVPRMRRDRPQSHVLVGRNGDLLRGRLLALSTTGVQFESRLNEVTLPRDRISGIVWLKEPSGDEEGQAAGPDEALAPPGADRPTNPSIQVTFRSGVVMTLVPETVVGDELLARHRYLGDCRVKLSSVVELRTGNTPRHSPEAQQPLASSEWTLIHAPEPVIPGANGQFGTYSELVGQPADDFTLPLLAGGDFRLTAHRGQIVVLDFWATWCGPCVQAMPQLRSAVADFPDDVKFVAVNQEESPDVVKAFLYSREWDLTVALDSRGEVGRQFQVQGIPQTVVVDRDGTIRHVHLGSSPDLKTSLKEVLASLIGESPAVSTE